MELPELSSGLYRWMTIPSVIHHVTLIIAYPVILQERSDLIQNERDAFSCEGADNDGHQESQCFTAYSNGPSSLHSWIALPCFVCPSVIIALAYLLITRKTHNLKKGNCTFHAHHFYLSHVLLCVLFHLSIIIAVIACDFGYGNNKLVLDGIYTCLAGNLTMHCTDEKSDYKTKLNIVCFASQIVLMLLLWINFFLFWRKWKPNTDWSEKEGPCRKCYYYSKRFSLFPGMYLLSNI